MSKSLKIFLAVLILISIGFSLSFFLEFGPFSKKKEVSNNQEALPPSQKSPITSSPEIPLPTLKEIPFGFSLDLPVEEKYLSSALVDKNDAQVISFFLDKDTPIKAVFDGKITKVANNVKPFPGDNAFEEIWLERFDGQYWASYVIFGSIQIKEGDIIKQGDVLGKANEGGLGFRGGTNLSFWLHNKNNDFMKLSKDLFTE